MTILEVLIGLSMVACTFNYFMLKARVGALEKVVKHYVLKDKNNVVLGQFRFERFDKFNIPPADYPPPQPPPKQK